MGLKLPGFRVAFPEEGGTEQLPDPQISGLVIFCAAIGRGAGYSCQATLCERRIKRAIDTDAETARAKVLLKPPRPKPTDDD